MYCRVVEIDELINLGQYLHGAPMLHYMLKAKIHHIVSITEIALLCLTYHTQGDTTACGHYTATVLRDGVWWRINGSSVERASADLIAPGEAVHVLYYERVEERQEEK